MCNVYQLVHMYESSLIEVDLVQMEVTHDLSLVNSSKPV